MPAIVLPFVRAEQHAQRPKVGRILTLEEVRDQMDRPPAAAVPWLVSLRSDPKRSVTVHAQLFAEARRLGCAELGTNDDQIHCVREGEALSGSGAA